MIGAYRNLRVIDLSNRLSGAYAARLFADFGAEVILLEPPQGHALRHEPPFLGRAAGVESAFLHAYGNWNKRSVVMAAEDSDELQQLAASAHLLITTADDEMTRCAVAALPSDRVHLAISPHGNTGPLATRGGNNLTACARVGWSKINARVDEAPLPLPVWQTGYIAGVAGFVVAGAAMLRWQRCGVGEHIDLSEVEALALTCAPWAKVGEFIGGDRLEHGVTGRRTRGMPAPLWATSDGQINFGYGDWAKWTEAMRFLGLDELAEDATYVPVLGRNQKDARPVRAALAQAAKTREKWELFEGLARSRCIAGVVQNTSELLENKQLSARSFHISTSMADEPVRTAGAPFKMSGTPWNLYRPAPRLGEHTAEIRSKMRERIETPQPSAPGEALQPLAGVRVLTFTQAWAGTFGTELLAFLGADVVQIEGRSRPDVWRGAGAPVPPAVRDSKTQQSPLNTNGMYNSVNLNKRAITLDMISEEGREMFWRMVPAFDVVAENFSPHVMSDWGITLETLSAVRPDIIFASLSGYGCEGPWAEYAANGATTEPMSGFSSIHGYDGDVAANTAGLIPDPICGYYFAGAIITALYHRESTGEGQRIDEAMMEAVAVQLGDAILAYSGNGDIARPQGNHHPRLAPHNVYPCADDQWLALAAETEDAWHALCGAIDLPQLRDDRFAGNVERKKNATALDEIIADWTRTRDALALENELGPLGICVAVIAPFQSTFSRGTPQFAARGFLQPVQHPESGSHLMPLAPWVMANTPRLAATHAPCFGQHSLEVFHQELGLSESDYQRLEAAGITGTSRL